MLVRSRERLLSAESEENAMEIVDLTERQLLAEVLEWYFHAETAEHFFFRREKNYTGRDIRAPDAREHSAVFRFLRRTLGITSVAGLFLLRVIIGRIPWIVASAAAALMWIAYHQPSDASEKDQLRALARLADANGHDWVPDAKKLEHGCVFIVHGLYGDINSDSEGKTWPKQCAIKITAATAPASPDICVVDWHQAAHTAQHNKLNIGLGLSEIENLLTDLAGVRPEAEEVGNLVAFRIAMMILDTQHVGIRRDQPLHLIGHSAGGFVVARVAVLLKRFNVAPENVHVTILDTPAPDPEVTKTLADIYPNNTVDFYISSDIGGRLETLHAAEFSSKIHRYEIPSGTSPRIEPNVASSWDRFRSSVQRVFTRAANVWVAHRYSFEWFMNTIDHPENYPGEGFNRSPFARRSSVNK
jgi:hypothetical protein